MPLRSCSYCCADAFDVLALGSYGCHGCAVHDVGSGGACHMLHVQGRPRRQHEWCFAKDLRLAGLLRGSTQAWATEAARKVWVVSVFTRQWAGIEIMLPAQEACVRDPR
jgi:hypothetical protein